MFTAIKNSSKKALATVGTAATFLAANLAYAVDDAAVTAAQDAGEASVGNAATGYIAILVVVVGLGLVASLLKKS